MGSLYAALAPGACPLRGREAGGKPCGCVHLLERHGQRREHPLVAVGRQSQGRVAACRDDVAHGRAEGAGVAGGA